jgi:hypothetical protein
METWSEAGETPDSGEAGPVPVPDTPPEASPDALAPGAAPDAAAPEGSLDLVEVVLDQVDQALARLDDGTYGRCVSCGQPIDDARLAGDPTVIACGECAEEPVIAVR